MMANYINRLIETENISTIDSNFIQTASNTSQVPAGNIAWRYWITTTLTGLASLFLLIYLILYLIKPGSKKLSNKVLASFSLGLFLVNSFGLFLPFVKNISETSCYVGGASLYYFSLSRYCWMNIMAFDIWRALRLSTSKLRCSTGTQRRRFLAYCACGWCLPLLSLIGMISLQFAHPDYILKGLKPFSWNTSVRPHCNLFNFKLLSIFYYGPIAASFLLNIVFFTLTARVMCKAKRGAINPKNSEFAIQFKMYIRLAVLLGVACVCFLVMVEGRVYYLHIVVAVLNLVQATSILVFFGCRRPPLSDRQTTMRSSISHGSRSSRSFRKQLSTTSNSSMRTTRSLSLSFPTVEASARRQSTRKPKISTTSNESTASSEIQDLNHQKLISEELTK
ncbi:unnamed protein product [Meganyctiphanes norvegica]|uniref:G-protein coupled receptors family 2 profile 2 domain-containing protein n=1 Tax=Meganyctiphanes norvegica TaxID=48144 RepID=A0AAV2RTH3_MEGNR